LHSISITLLVHWPYMCDTSLDAHWRQLQHLKCFLQLTVLLRYSQYCLRTTFVFSTIHKNIKEVEKISRIVYKSDVFVTHVTVAHGTSKAYQLITIKLQKFWHRRDFCSLVEKESNRDDRHTHTHTHTQTHTHTHKHTHTDIKVFNALSCSETSITSRKVIKSGVPKNLFFAWIQYFGILLRAEVIY
jgi:hypothetical protein